MNNQPARFIELDSGKRIAYHQTPGAGPGVLFLGGFKSDMTGTKALALEAWCRRAGRPFTRFDYSGHGTSSGTFEQGTIGEWLDDTLAVIDRLTDGPLVLVGSSMGGWLALHATLARPDRVDALLTLACATDFTERLLMARFGEEQLEVLEREGRLLIPCDYDDQQPYPITRELLQEGRQHLLLDGPIPIHCPVRMLHGMQDPDVPWAFSLQTCEQLESDDATLTLIKRGDHRLSTQADLDLICHTLARL
ncbi:MAG: alpha/beta hydrolase [Sedimenticola sp.]|nr:alpha/beta hydrolase [Sedimenticola sp.]